MSKTYRTKHLSPSRYKKRGPKNRPEDDAPRAIMKSRKQQRPNDRARLRKEYL